MSNRALKVGVLVGAALGFARQTHAANPADFQVINYFHVDGSGSSVLSMPGRLYVPTNYNPANSYPIVMFLHGSGEAGTNNTSQVNGNIDNLLAAAKSRNFFLFAPQSGGSAWQSGQTVTAVKMLATITNSYHIDTSRMYVTGLSYGGAGTWTVLGADRDVFAAGVPIVAEANYPIPATLVGKPTWSYEALDDPFLNTGRSTVQAIHNAAGGSTVTLPITSSSPYYVHSPTSGGAYPYTSGSYYGSDPTTGGTLFDDGVDRYSEYNTGGHTNATWGRAYAEQPMYDWLLSQTNKPHTLKPGETILFDPGENVTGAEGALPTNSQGYTADSKGRVWNCDATYKESASVGPAVPFAQTTTGINSTVTIAVGTPFYSRVTTGVTTGSLYDPLVSIDGWLSNTTNIGSLIFEGLTPGSQYKLSVFGSDTLSGHSGRYTIADQSGSQFIDLVNTNNANNLAVFNTVTANSLGQFTLTVAPAPGSSFADLNAVELTALPEPTSLIALGSIASAALLRRRRPQTCKQL